jgi:hypothetical protein
MSRAIAALRRAKIQNLLASHIFKFIAFIQLHNIPIKPKLLTHTNRNFISKNPYLFLKKTWSASSLVVMANYGPRGKAKRCDLLTESHQVHRPPAMGWNITRATSSRAPLPGIGRFLPVSPIVLHYLGSLPLLRKVGTNHFTSGLPWIKTI